MLEVEEHFSNKELRFCVLADCKDALDKLSFVHLVVMKFSGQRIKTSSRLIEKNLEIEVRVQFLDWLDFSNAKVHCNQNLDANGNIEVRYVGALDYADPSRKMGRSIIKEAIKNRE